MSFGAPLVLAALLLVPAAIVWYVRQQRYRRRAAAAFATPALLASVAPRRPGWRRHAPMLAFLLALAVLIVAAAKPQKTAYEMLRSLVGSEMCIRDRPRAVTAPASAACPVRRRR